MPAQTTCTSSAPTESFHATIDESLLYVLAQDILERGKKSRQAMQRKNEDDDARERTRLSRARLAASPLGTFFLKSRDSNRNNDSDELFDRDGCLRLLAEARHVAYVIVGSPQQDKNTCDRVSERNRREEKKDKDSQHQRQRAAMAAWDIIDLVPVRLSPLSIPIPAASGCSAGGNNGDDCMSVSESEENHLAEVATFLINCLVPGDQHIVGVVATPPISYAPSSSANSSGAANSTNNNESDTKKKAQEEAKINVKTAILTSAFLKALQNEMDTMTTIVKRGTRRPLALVQASLKPSQPTSTACATTGKHNDDENKDRKTNADDNSSSSRTSNKGMTSCCAKPSSSPSLVNTTSGTIKFIAHLADSGEAFIFPSHSHHNPYEDRREEENKSATGGTGARTTTTGTTTSSTITTIPAYVTIKGNTSRPPQTTAKTDENGCTLSSSASSSHHELIRFCCPLSKWTSLLTKVKEEGAETPQQNEIWRVSSKPSSRNQQPEHGGPHYIPINKGFSSPQYIKLPSRQQECEEKGGNEEKGKAVSTPIINIEPLTFGPTAAASGSSLVYVPIFVRHSGRNACRGERIEISTHFVEEALRAVARGANEYATRREERENESQLLLHQSPRITYAGIVGNAIFWNGLGVLGDYFTDESDDNSNNKRTINKGVFTSISNLGEGEEEKLATSCSKSHFALSSRSGRSKASTLLRSTSALPKITDGNSPKPDSTKKRTTRRRDCISDNTLIQLVDTIFAPKALPCMFSSARSELITTLHSSGGRDDQCRALLNEDFYFYGSPTSIESFAVSQPSTAGAKNATHQIGVENSDDGTLMKRPRACCGPPIDPHTKPFSARVFNLISLALFTMTIIGSYLILSSPTY